MIPLDGIHHWISNIPLWYFFLIVLCPLTIEYVRTIGYIVFLELNKIKSKNLAVESYLKVHDKKISILIPAHNEELCIKESIESSLSTFYPNKEIIVIDDSSTDETYNIAKKYADRNQIRIIKMKKGGSKAAALNFGFRQSRGEIIITMDADTKLECHSLEKIARKFDDQRINALSGNLVSHGDDNITNMLTKMQSHEYSTSFEIGKRFSSQLNAMLMIHGAFAIFRRTALDCAGLFSTDTMTEDFDMTIQVQRIGQKMEFAKKSYAHTYSPNNWKTWISQKSRWSCGHLQTLLKNKDILFSSRCRLGLRLAILDIWFTDIVLNFMYAVGLITFLSFVVIPQLIQGKISEEIINFGYLSVITILMYLIAEFAIFLYSRNKSDNPQPIREIHIVPLVVLFYKPLLKILAFKSYIKVMMGKSVEW